MTGAGSEAPARARMINQDYAGGERDVEVPFNPEAYTLSREARWREHAVLLADIPKVEFVGGERRRLLLDLVIDTTREGRDAREETDRIEDFARIDPDLHRPPHLLFSWGSLQLDGVLEAMETRYVLFERDGTPRRALVRLRIIERVPGEERDRRPLQSPDRAKRRRVRAGEDLPRIAYQEYQDAGAWRRIADANGLDDPDEIEPGRLLVVPPMQRRIG